VSSEQAHGVHNQVTYLRQGGIRLYWRHSGNPVQGMMLCNLFISVK